MKICINAGHTIKGPGSGSIGIKNESIENRNIAREVTKLLQNNGYEVVDATVDSAKSSGEYLEKCVSIANKSKADLFVSIHFNAFDKVANGCEVLVYNKNNTSYDYAKKIVGSISNIGFRNRGVKERPDLYVLRKTTMPAILVECMFIDNRRDVAMYDAKSMAKAIYDGIHNEVYDVDEKYYRVCIGSFKNKDNAIKMMNEAKVNGYKDSFIM